MKKNLKYGSALLLCAVLLAGCSQSPTASSEKNPASSTTASSSTVAAENPLSSLVEASGDDAAAESAWMTVFQKTADAYGGSFEAGSDGDIYEYQTAEDSSFVDASRLYETGRENYVTGTDGTILGADVLALDNSDEVFLSGSGVLTRIDENSQSAVVKLTSTKDDTLEGSVTRIVADSYTADSFAAQSLYDSVINAGFSRTVNPVHNSSLYSYDLQESGQGYTLNLKVKDLEAFKEKAAASSVLVQNLDEKMVLGLDEITDETFVFHFTKDGVLTEAANNIFHAVYDDGNKTYVNVRNETRVEALDDKASFEKAIGGFMQGVAEGTTTEGSSFTLTDWQ